MTSNLTVSNGIDISNNTAITFNQTPYTIYWVGGTNAANLANKGGTYSTGDNNNWSNPDNWSIVDGSYSGQNSCIPRIEDAIVFNANSYTASANSTILDIDGEGESITFVGVTNTPTFTAASTRNLTITGDYILDPSMVYNNSGTVELTAASGAGPFSITSAGHTLANNLLIKTSNADVNREYDLTDALTLSNELQLDRGGIDFNGHTVNLVSLDASINTDRLTTLNFNGSTVNISGGGIYTVGNQQIVFNLEDAGDGNLTILGAETATVDFIGNVADVQLRLGRNSKTVPNLVFTGTNDDVIIFTRRSNNCTGNEIIIGDITIVKDLSLIHI